MKGTVVIFLCRYNIGHVGVALGDLGLAYQGFKVAVSIDANHGEALNNLAVLESRRLKPDVARSFLSSSIDVSPQLFEPLYNIGTIFNTMFSRGPYTHSCDVALALYYFRAGEFQEAFLYVNRALKIYPAHTDSLELHAQLQAMFSAM
jgi:tetratricopeptide repeat protein 8